MAEAIGLAASAITLASLFASCVECFNYFSAAQQCRDEAERLLVKLDCEKTRLLAWANAVGVYRAINEGRAFQLDDPQIDRLIRQCIEQISILLTDGKTLEGEYGSRPASEVEAGRQLQVSLLSKNGMDDFKVTKRRFFSRFGYDGKQMNIVSKIKWAVRDKVKFEGLLIHLRYFIDELIQTVPAQQQKINDMVEDDIASIVGLRSLRLVENAFEDVYPRWAAKASEIITESEMGTVDRRTFEEYVEDYEDDQIASQLKSQNARDGIEEEKSLTLPLNTPATIVLTGPCLNADLVPHCGEEKVGFNSLDPSYRLSLCSNPNQWLNLGSRISDRIFTPADHELLEETRKRSHELLKVYGKPITREKTINWYIYCAPCACQIQTAAALASGANRTCEILRCYIRIDDSIPSSCGRSTSGLPILTAIREQYSELALENAAGIYPYVHWAWMEQRMYKLEEESYQHSVRKPHQILPHIFSDHQDQGAIIVLAEADLCATMLETSPLPKTARRPRETDMFQVVRKQSEIGADIWERNYIGSYTRSRLSLLRSKQRALGQTLTPPPSSMTGSRSPSVRSVDKTRSNSNGETDRVSPGCSPDIPAASP